MTIKPVDQMSFAASELTHSYPPRWNNRNKELVFEIANGSGFSVEGRIVYTRWPALELPADVTTARRFSVRDGVFQYAVSTESQVAWHLNFADPRLFVAYGSALLAQDELQVAEHPILGSLREALTSMGNVVRTVDDEGNPTPVTITGVQRRCAINTCATPACPGGLYGNAFARATPEQVAAATTPILPPTTSNILAVSAPAGGHGNYRREEILYILRTAYSGFSAARQESERLAPMCSGSSVHTGFWGCGAFGGNRTLMTILQALAADLAGIDVIFWAIDKPGIDLAEEAYRSYIRLRSETASVTELLDNLVQQKFLWGVSDGN
jgi:hypothetical protein